MEEVDTTLIKSTNDIDALPVSLYGRALFYCLNKVRCTVVNNIEQVFKESLTAYQKKHLALAFFSQMATTVKETYAMHRNKNWVKPTIEIRGIEHLIQAHDKGTGVIILTGHFGSWELGILEGLTQVAALKNNMYVLRRRLSPKLQKILDALYKNYPVNIIEKKGAIKAACHALSNQGTLIFAFDTHVSPDKSQGIDVEFFGKKTGCNRSLAVLAQRTKAVVVPLDLYRANTNHHVFEFHPALPWIDSPDKKKILYDNTLQYNKVLEHFILQHPERWWSWVYRHWYS